MKISAMLIVTRSFMVMLEYTNSKAYTSVPNKWEMLIDFSSTPKLIRTPSQLLITQIFRNRPKQLVKAK